MNKFTSFFLFLSTSLIIWGSSVLVSNYLSRSYEREQKHKAHINTNEVSESVSAHLDSLRKAASDNPKDINSQVLLGYAVFSHSMNTGNGSMLMEAVKAFRTAIDIDSENPEALLGLASLCMQAGINDKAIEYYPRYLKIKPEDKRARADFALVNFKIGNFEKGKAIIDEILKADPQFYSAHMVLAFAYKAKGDNKNANAQAMLAKQKASSPEVKNQIDSFFSDLDSGKKPKPIQRNSIQSTKDAKKLKVADSAKSVEQEVEDYLRSHSIIGQKIKNITWDSGNSVLVSLFDFPIESMPPFAKQIFNTKAKENLKSLGRKVEIKLFDHTKPKELLEISVGEQE